MSTRKIKDAQDTTTNELIYFKGHAMATYMSDGTLVEDAINQLDNNKQDKISDLQTIRENATLGANAYDALDEKVNTSSLASVATTGNYNDLINKPTIDSVMSDSSINSVQNKIIKSYIDNNCNIPVERPTHTSLYFSLTIMPNTYYELPHGMLSYTITLATPSNQNILNNYMFEFSGAEDGSTLSLPDNIEWIGGVAPTIEAATRYQVSIINNLATIAKFGIAN